MNRKRLQLFLQAINYRSNKILIFCVVLGIVILSFSKLPFLWAPYGHDQGNYIYLGREILNGAVPYRDFFDHKLPGFPIINAVVWAFGINSPVPFRIVEYVWTVATFLLFVVLLRRLFSHSPVTVGIGSILFSLFLGNILFSTADGGGYTEGYLLLLNIVAVILLLRYERVHHPKILFWVGLLIFISFSIKQVGLFLFIPTIFFITHLWYKTYSSWKQSIRPTIVALIWLGLGFIIPIGLFLLYLYFQDALPYFYDEMIRFNRLYSQTSTFWNKFFTSVYTLHQFAVSHPVIYFLVILGVGSILMRASRYRFLLIAWLVSDLAAIGLTGWFFPHYYIQFFPIVAIFASYGCLLLVDALQSMGQKHRELLILLALPFFLLIFIPYFSTPTINYIHRWRDLQVTTVPGSWQKLAPDLIAYVDERTEPGDAIYVWDSAQIYVYLYTQTVSSSRYYNGIPLAEMHAPGFVTTKHWERFKNDLIQRPPKIIVINESVYSGIKKNELIWNYIQNKFYLDKTITSPNGPTELYLPKIK